jgi:hypothetical protein
VKPISLVFNDVDSNAIINHPEFGEIMVCISDYHDEDDGIGSYEYHGAVGFDSKPMHVVDDIDIVDHNLTFDEELTLKVWLEEMWNSGKIEATVSYFDSYQEDDYEL